MQTARISIDESFEVPADPQRVWALITDPRVVVACMPGATIAVEHEDGSLEGTLQVKLGPTVVNFRGRLEPTFDQAARRGELVATGGDGGRTKARAVTTFAVEDGAMAGARVLLGGNIQVTGGLAPFVRTGGTHLTRRMVTDFATNLESRVMRSSSGAAPDDSEIAPPAAAPIGAVSLVIRTMRDLLKAALQRLVAALRRRTTRGER